MASWIIHLRVAQGIYERMPALDRAAFVMGSIAPDSGVPNQDWSAYTPDAALSHFRTIDENGIKAVHEERFVQQYLKSDQLAGYTLSQTSFYLGYYAHLLTDKLWTREIVYPAKAQFSDLFQRDKDAFTRFIKRDWYDMDFLYLKHHPDFAAFRLYESTVDFENIYMDIFAPDAFENRRQYITGFYHQGASTVEERTMYLTTGQLDAFVEGAVSEITEELISRFPIAFAGWDRKGMTT